MKKLFTLSLLWLAVITAAAQDADFNNIRIVVGPGLACGETINATGYYAPVDEAAPPAASHQWTITLCDEEGNTTGEPLLVNDASGAPADVFFESGTLECDRIYSIGLSVTDANGVMHTTSSIFRLSQASCVSDFTDTFFKAPGEVQATTSGSLNLPPGNYYYTRTVLATSNNVLLNNNNVNFDVNFTSVTPNNTFTITANNTPCGFQFVVSPLATLCTSSAMVTYKFYTQVGSSSYLQCTYSIYIYVMKNSKQTIACMPSGNWHGTYYQGDDDKIHRMYWANNQWNNQPIIPWNGWGSIAVDGWLSVDNPTDKIFFKGTDNKLYNVLLSSSSHQVGAIGNVSNVKSDLQYRSNECVYIGTDTRVHRVYWSYSTNSWQSEAISPTNDPNWINVTAVGGLALAPNWPSKNIFFRDQNGGIQNLYWDTSVQQWYMVPVTPINGVVACDGDLLFDEALARIYYRSTSTSINNVTYGLLTGNWTHDPMTSANGNVTVMNTMTKLPGDERVFFKGSGDRAYSYWKLNGQWRIDWLNGPYTNVLGDLVAADWTHVYYVSKSKYVGNYWYPGQGAWSSGPLMSSGPFNSIGCSGHYRSGTIVDSSSVFKQGNSPFILYPNPGNGSFTLEFGAPSNATAELFNLLGEKIDAFTFSGASYRYVPEHHLTPGIYLLHITRDGERLSKKILVD